MVVFVSLVSEVQSERLLTSVTRMSGEFRRTLTVIVQVTIETCRSVLAWIVVTFIHAYKYTPTLRTSSASLLNTMNNCRKDRCNVCGIISLKKTEVSIFVYL